MPRELLANGTTAVSGPITPWRGVLTSISDTPPGIGASISTHRWRRNGRMIKTQGYIVDVCTDRALSFIDKNKAKPFLCYIPFTTPHSPWAAPEKDWQRFKDKPSPNVPPWKRMKCSMKLAARSPCWKIRTETWGVCWPTERSRVG